MKTNFGYIYNKEFFTWLNIRKKGVGEAESNKLKYYFYPDLKYKNADNTMVNTPFGDFNDRFLNAQLEKNEVNDFINKFKEEQVFELKTIYPGLLSGSGYLHEVGEKNDDEFKLGFFFDYTTGLPVIPASSIKGVLRYACEMIKDTKDKDYLYSYKKLKEKIGFSVEEKYFEPIPNNKDNNKFFPSEFVYNVFEGKEIVRKGGKIEFDKKGEPVTKGISIYKRDIFHDAFPIKSEKSLFGMDYITHHEHELKNPNPVKFLRVQPEVTYKFQFDLKDNDKGLKAEDKLALFEQIILDLGLGAKTNVGYGQFVELSKKELEDERREYHERRIRLEREENPPYQACCDNAKAYITNTVIDVKIIKVGKYVSMKDEEGSIFTKSEKNIKKKFEKDLKRKQKKNPDIKFKDLKVGMETKIQIKQDLNVNVNDAVFTVLPVIE